MSFKNPVKRIVEGELLMVTLDLLMEYVTEQGFSSAVFQLKGDLLIIRLSAAEQDRLLADEVLREDLVAQVRGFGFSRIALDIS